jgi:hypothetical protein
MNEQLERILANDIELVPSAGFTDSVMAVIEVETSAVRLEFPWRRALPGGIALLAALVAMFWNGIGMLNDPAATAALEEKLGQLMSMAAGFGASWVALGVAVTVASLWLPRSVVSRRAGIW